MRANSWQIMTFLCNQSSEYNYFVPVQCNTEAPHCGYAVEPLWNDHHQNQGKCTLEEWWSWVKGPNIRTAPITGQWHCHYCTLREGWSWVKGPNIRTAPITGQWHCHYCTLQEGWSWIKGSFTLEQLQSQANDNVIIVPYTRGGYESRRLFILEQLQSEL